MTKYDKMENGMSGIGQNSCPDELQQAHVSCSVMRSFADLCSLDSETSEDILSSYAEFTGNASFSSSIKIFSSVMFADPAFQDVDRRLEFESQAKLMAVSSVPERFYLFCALGAYAFGADNFKKAGFPLSALHEGVADLAVHARQYRNNCGVNGLSWNSFCWFGNIIRGTVIRQGRLEFNTEMSLFENIWAWRNMNDGTLLVRRESSRPEGRWTEVIGKGDPVIYLHIPGGEPLKTEACISSLRRIIGFFEKYIPDYKYRALATTSWLLDPQLKSILGHRSNIVKIQRLLRIYPSSLEGSDAVERVFGTKDAKGVKGVKGVKGCPHVTSMQKRMSEFLDSGGKFRFGTMFILPDELEMFMNRRGLA